jgi:hypothetical protein
MRTHSITISHFIILLSLQLPLSTPSPLLTPLQNPVLTPSPRTRRSIQPLNLQNLTTTIITPKPTRNSRSIQAYALNC